MNQFSLKDKVVLITGASSGIGKQCAISCAQMGAKIVLVGRDKKRLEDTKDKLIGNSHISFVLDITQYDQLEEIISHAVSKLGVISGFIHSAGHEITLPLNVMKPVHYEQIMAVNVIAAFEIVKLISKKKYAAEQQSVILISSIYGQVGNIALTAYSASKGALIAATKSLAIELAPKKCRVNVISPGWIQGTGITKEHDSLVINSEKETEYPLGYGKTTDVAYACIYLLSDASCWVTGTNLIVDGGYTAK